MKMLTARLSILHIIAVDDSSYKQAYDQLQNEHETWFKCLLLGYPERFQTALPATLILGVLCCLVGGVGYFFEFSQFGHWSVAAGLSFFGAFVALLVLGHWSNNWHYNTPTGDTDLNKTQVEQYSRLPSTVQNIIGVIEQHTDRNISFHFSFEGFFNPQTETETVLWSLWADDTSERGDWCKRVYFWVDGPRTVELAD